MEHAKKCVVPLLSIAKGTLSQYNPIALKGWNIWLRFNSDIKRGLYNIKGWDWFKSNKLKIFLFYFMSSV